jgi:hypothetical protein
VVCLVVIMQACMLVKGMFVLLQLVFCGWMCVVLCLEAAAVHVSRLAASVMCWLLRARGCLRTAVLRHAHALAACCRKCMPRYITTAGGLTAGRVLTGQGLP